MIELLSCPFCGSVDLMQIFNDKDSVLCIQCNQCRALGPYINEDYPDDCPNVGTRAAEAWNKRVDISS